MNAMRKDFNMEGDMEEEENDEEENDDGDLEMANELGVQDAVEEIKQGAETLKNYCSSPIANDQSEAIEAAESLQSRAHLRDDYEGEQRNLIEKVYLNCEVVELTKQVRHLVSNEKSITQLMLDPRFAMYEVLLVMLLGLTDWSEKVCKACVEAKIGETMLEELATPEMKPGQKMPQKIEALIIPRIALIWNILQKCPQVISSIRDMNGVKILKMFVKESKDRYDS